MKAAYFEKFGGPEVLQYGDVPDPVPAAGQIVADEYAASIDARRLEISRRRICAS